jgi:hypothetical protein
VLETCIVPKKDVYQLHLQMCSTKILDVQYSTVQYTYLVELLFKTIFRFLPNKKKILLYKKAKESFNCENNTQIFSYWHLSIFLGAVGEGGFNLTICKNFFRNK